MHRMGEFEKKRNGVSWFWGFLQEGEEDLHDGMGLCQAPVYIMSNPHHNPSRAVSPPTWIQ